MKLNLIKKSMKLNLIKKSMKLFFSEQGNIFAISSVILQILPFPCYILLRELQNINKQKCHEKRMSDPKKCSVKCFDFYDSDLP